MGRATRKKPGEDDEGQEIERLGSIIFTFIFWGLIMAIIAFIAFSELAGFGLRDATIGAILVGLSLGWLAATLNLARRIAGVFAGIFDIAGWFS
jgi:hypothetical protein